MESGAASVIMDGMMSMLPLSVDSLGSCKNPFFINEIIVNACEKRIKTA